MANDKTMMRERESKNRFKQLGYFQVASGPGQLSFGMLAAMLGHFAMSSDSGHSRALLRKGAIPTLTFN